MDLRSTATDRLTLLRDMRDALVSEQFVLHYQPIYVLEGRQLAGFEALIRWRHPTRGLVPPLTFLDLAEESGLICDMGLWVVQRACEDWPALRRLTVTQRPFLSINISPAQLADGTFADVAMGIQRAAGMDPAELKLELTESTFIQNQAVAQAQLHRLGEFGNSIALDDYGTGFSGLAHLQNYRFHTLKLDQLFIREIQNSSLSFQLVMSTLDMVRALQINAVGEGIETDAVADILQQLGCQYGQGFLFGRPLALEDLLVRNADDAAVRSAPSGPSA
jgi:EAL domain-containing protein (putative c-di-GMP-specific phosphodiesterase class I)